MVQVYITDVEASARVPIRSLASISSRGGGPICTIEAVENVPDHAVPFRVKGSKKLPGRAAGGVDSQAGAKPRAM